MLVVVLLSMGACACVWECHTLLCTVCAYESLLCVSVYEWLYASVRVCGPVCVSVCVCVPTATVGCGGWNVCFSAGPVRPLLLNICPQHINSPTLTHPSLPRDHLIEIHNDSFFSSSPTLSKVRLENVFLEKRGIFLSDVIKPLYHFLSCLFFWQLTHFKCILVSWFGVKQIMVVVFPETFH